MKNILYFAFFVCVFSISSTALAKSFVSQAVNMDNGNCDRECLVKPKHCGNSDKIDGCYSKEKLVNYFSGINFVTSSFQEGWFYDSGFKDYLFGWYESDNPCAVYMVSTCNRETVGFMWKFYNNKWNLERVF